MSRRDPGQATLLDSYWMALRRNAGVAPPLGLDPSSAAIVAALERELRPPEPTADFLKAQRQRLRAEAASGHAVNPTSGLVLDSVPEAVALPVLHATPVHTESSYAPRWLPEVGKLVAAILAFALVTGMLVTLFGIVGNGDEQGTAEPLPAGVDPTWTIDSPPTRDPEASVAVASSVVTQPVAPIAVDESEPGEVLFVWDTGELGSTQLWIVSTAGGEPRRLLHDVEDIVEQEVWPEWSPDGSRLAFVGMEVGTGNRRIYVVNADGSGLRMLSDTPSDQTGIVWSPDGTRMAFTGREPGLPVDDTFVGVFTVDDGAMLRLTEHGLQASPLAWSPDGQQITFGVRAEDRQAVYVMDSDGANQRELPVPPGADSLSWSPDGSRLLFMIGWVDEMYLIDADGANLVSLSARGIWGHTPLWSPDGRTIAFIGGTMGVSEAVMLVDSDLTNLRQVTTERVHYIYHGWSEDGRHIVWAAQRDVEDSPGSSASELWITHVDGSGQRLLASGPEFMMTPRWRPAGVRAAPAPQPTWPADMGTPVPTRTPTPPVLPTYDTSGPPWPAPTEQHCDVSLRPWFLSAYVMNADGSDVRPVFGPSDLAGDDVVWTPDGRSVTYFTTLRDDTVDPAVTPSPDAQGRFPVPATAIVLRDIASGEVSVLIEVANAWSLAWAPDGSQLAFIETTYEGSTQQGRVVVINADGTGLIRFAGELSDLDSNARLGFTPDGPHIAFVRDDDVWSMHADGSGLTNLTNSDEGEFDPIWTRDGELVFQRFVAPPTDYEHPHQLFAVRPDGSGMRELDIFASGDSDPDWTRDGSRIAFTRAGEIWVMNVDGTDARNMTQHAAPDRVPQWSPDGTRILFLGSRSPEPEVRHEAGRPQPIVLRHGDSEQQGTFVTACWVTGMSRSVQGTATIAFPAEPLQLPQGAPLTLDFSSWGQPGTLAITVYDLAATRANGKGVGEDAILRPCAAPGGTEDGCLVLSETLQPLAVSELHLPLPPGDYVIVIGSDITAGTEYGFIEQAFHVLVTP